MYWIASLPVHWCRGPRRGMWWRIGNLPVIWRGATAGPRGGVPGHGAGGALSGATEPGLADWLAVADAPTLARPSTRRSRTVLLARLHVREATGPDRRRRAGQRPEGPHERRGAPQCRRGPKSAPAHGRGPRRRRRRRPRPASGRTSPTAPRPRRLAQPTPTAAPPPPPPSGSPSRARRVAVARSPRSSRAAQRRPESPPRIRSRARGRSSATLPAAPDGQRGTPRARRAARAPPPRRRRRAQFA